MLNTSFKKQTILKSSCAPPLCRRWSERWGRNALIEGDAALLVAEDQSPSPPDPNPFQHQGLFQWVNFAWGAQSTGVSALALFLLKNSQDLSPLECHRHLKIKTIFSFANLKKTVPSQLTSGKSIFRFKFTYPNYCLLSCFLNLSSSVSHFYLVNNNVKYIFQWTMNK